MLNLLIGESQKADAELFNPRLAIGIVFGSIISVVCCAIYFNGQFHFGAIKVENISTN